MHARLGLQEVQSYVATIGTLNKLNLHRGASNKTPVGGHLTQDLSEQHAPVVMDSGARDQSHHSAMTSTEEITDNSGQPPHKSPKGSSTDTPNPSRPATKPEVINIPSSSSSSGGEDSNFDMAEFMRANANVLKVLKKFKFTEAKDGKRYAFAQELVQKLLTVAPDHADFANTFSNMVEKHANAWRNNEATTVLCESLCLWMKHYECPIHRSILIQIELDAGANRKLLMNNGNTRLFTTASNWLFKGHDFSLDIHAFQPLIACKTK